MLQTTDPKPPNPPATVSFFSIFPSIILPIFLAVVDQTIVATALPAIAGDLGSIDRAPWIVISYLVAATIAAPVYGRLGDLLGRRRLMFLALAISMGASIVCALSVSMEMLIAARVVQGLGGGGLMTLSQAMVGEAVPPRDRARYHGYLAGVAVTSSMFGPVAGGFLTQHFGWQSVFLVNVPVAMIAFFMTMRLASRPGSGGPFRFDAAGLLLFAAFITTTLIMLQETQGMTLESLPLIGGMLLASVVSVLLLIAREKRASDPLIPLTVLQHPSIWRSDALAACHGGMIVSLITFTPIYLRVVYGTSPGETGLLMIPMTVLVGLGSTITGRVVSHTGRTAVFPTCGLLAVTVVLAVLAWQSPHMSVGQVSATLGLASLFMGTVMNVVQVTVQSSAGLHMLGTAGATVQFSRSLGAALGTATVGAVLFSAIGDFGPEGTELLGTVLQLGPEALADLPAATRETFRVAIAGAFSTAFATIAAFSAVGTALAWSLPMRRI